MIPSISLYEMLERTTNKFSNHPAVSFNGAKMTYSGLLDNVKRCAASLQQIGIKKGDRVALMLSNCPEYVIAYYGILRAGGIVVQINPRLTSRELGIILKDSGSKLIFVLDSVADIVFSVYDQCPLETIIKVNPINQTSSEFQHYLQTDSSNLQPVHINPDDDLAILQYTGGTTGVSKGVMLTHSNLVANVRQQDEMFKDSLVHGKEVVLGVLPLFHVYAMTVVMNLSLFQGSCIVLLENFQTDQVLNAIKEEKVTRFAGVPTMYIALNSHPEIENYGLDQIKVFQSGGASLPAEVIRSFDNRASAYVLEAYGLTESSPAAIAFPPKPNRKIGSVGLPLPWTEVKIMDIETGTTELPVGHEGELILKGPQIMKGYWGMREETEYALRDGWLYTGDIAKMDHDGYIYIVDRKKDLILASGFNVYPREIEEVLFEHPAILEAAVVGVKDDYRGENVKAYILLKDGFDVTEKDIIDFCKTSLVNYKVPRIIEFVDELPKTQVGKISRVALRNR
ncbi:long-chain fatty acid--CoA ligase [Lysinibacillus yapensis]|uniref:Long-chain fatty acid--CoA ligase n=1 Tax=Ureibacillus yapensis TaxID=2304605 RepID=A0A396SBI5_9BACL|nr:long-chain fatty acid--CoA ligase [Lysinibacillus yapensis]RHW36843.1 long-chain fatty acid--CoA ligase [Lysinibacillus yapensis]